MSSEMVERFWRKVERRGPDDCWLWTATASKNRCGQSYGYFRANGKMVRACRLVLEIDGRPLKPGQVARHKCDNSLCVNPRHLEGGTQRENVADRYDRFRANHSRGERHGNAKLSASEISEIRERLAAGESQRALAKQYGVSQFGIRYARDGWVHV